MSNSRVPTAIPEFNTYITNTNTYLHAGGPPTNLTRLGLSDDNGKDWDDYQKAWAELYLKYSNALTSTSIIKENVKHAMHDFKAFAQPLLNIIAASPEATDDDAAVFNLVLDKNHKNPSRPTTPISDTVMAE